MMNDDARLPLQGVKVVDLTSVIFGPYASQFLADFGANVIKVEAPGGDSSRRVGPACEPNMASSFVNLNRSKRSIVLDLKQESARQTLHLLLQDADVLMYNIRPQKLEALGLRLEVLRERHPRLVVASLNGYAEEGPYAGQPAYDDLVQGMCGMVDLMHRVSGEMRYLPSAIADKVCGLIAAQAILAAVIGRDHSGKGMHVEIPMFETMVSFTLVEHWGGQSFIPDQGGTGYSRVLSKHRRPLATQDGHMTVMPYTDEQWIKFFKEIGRPELAQDPRYSGFAVRAENINSLLEIVSNAVASRTSAEWEEAGARLDIPVARIVRIDDLSAHPHLSAVGHFRRLDRGDGKSAFCLPDNGVRFNGQQAPMRSPPSLGEHTEEILAEAGLPAHRVRELMSTGAAH